MLRGIRLSVDKLHQINLTYASNHHRRNPINIPQEQDSIVGDYTLDEMADIENEFLVEKLF